MYVMTGARYPEDLVARLANAGGYQRGTNSESGRRGHGEPEQAALPVPPPAQRSPGGMACEHGQGDEVDIADHREACPIDRPPAHRRRVQRAQEDQRG